jgi:hypothetical protein
MTGMYAEVAINQINKSTVFFFKTYYEHVNNLSL